MANLKDWVAGDKVLAKDLNQMFSFHIRFHDEPSSIIGITYDSDNNYLYSIGSTRKLYRWQFIGNNNIHYNSGSTTSDVWLDLSATYSTLSFTGLGNTSSYIWAWARQTIDTNYYLLRIDKSTGTATEMTFSGTAPDNDNNNAVTSDGTYIYIADITTTTVRKYSISGTTATLDSTITLSKSVDQSRLFVCDGTYFWYYDNASATNLIKDDITGTNVTNVKGLYYGNGSGGFVYNGVVYSLSEINIGGTAISEIHAVDSI